MSKLATSRIPGSSLLRTRAAVVAVSLGASAFLGAGVAAAADTGVTASALSKTTAASVAAQADAQAKAATVAKTSVTEAAAKKAGGWVKPVKRYTLTASFAQAGGMWSQKHSGQDFAVPVGTPVAAVGGGTVVKAGPNGAGDGPAYGNAIVIKHGNGTYSQYAHLSKVNVRVGQAVKAGQKIALSGNTGNSSGPHLHFEIRTTPNYGSAINPAAFLRAHGVSI
ncbi:M23 family metallopeptidase [Streptomyces jeddahensis]|uniref:Murein DD-endopeptidase MepM n=1 Tax=Streptomyces jeddahensis TaxID=1716141 RepID=A0A177HI68_9ACTN|nr:M23 family metallopeptidase [Streptomyces jeddahensis]OAH10605.1 murein DD-endopeptidase MepM [Streptomyces jeddahensis]